MVRPCSVGCNNSVRLRRNSVASVAGITRLDSSHHSRKCCAAPRWQRPGREVDGRCTREPKMAPSTVLSSTYRESRSSRWPAVDDFMADGGLSSGIERFFDAEHVPTEGQQWRTAMATAFLWPTKRDRPLPPGHAGVKQASGAARRSARSTGDHDGWIFRALALVDHRGMAMHCKRGSVRILCGPLAMR
jgi:hypothetical protein